jgi:hypothetical protein
MELYYSTFSRTVWGCVAVYGGANGLAMPYRPLPRQVGTFYEGVMTRGYSTNATDAAVQARR